MADFSFNSIKKINLQKLKSFLLSKDALSFLLFFILSALFWFVNALDKDREITLRIPVQLKNLPEQIAVTSHVPDFISVDVRDVGLNLFSYSDKKIKPLFLSLANINFDAKGKVQIDAATLNVYLKSYLLPTTRILAYKPDTINIAYEKLAKKSVPVKIRAKIETEKQYMIAGKEILYPSTLMVFGPERVLDTLQWIETEYIELMNLNDTISVNLKIKPLPFVKPENKNVKLIVPVEMFTEKTVELPVDALNFPETLKLKTFPAFVKANLNISVTEFSKFKPQDIQVYVDYVDLKDLKSPKYKLKFSSDNPHIQNIRLNPSEVEFIIEHY